MPDDPPPPRAFVLTFRRSRDGRWQGRLLHVETNAEVPFTTWEGLYHAMLSHGLHLDLLDDTTRVCPLCRQSLVPREDLG